MEDSQRTDLFSQFLDLVETRDHVWVLLSRQVVDVAKLMKAYISMIVKKRYSTTRSVSSQGSSR